MNINSTVMIDFVLEWQIFANLNEKKMMPTMMHVRLNVQKVSALVYFGWKRDGGWCVRERRFKGKKIIMGRRSESSSSSVAAL